MNRRQLLGRFAAIAAAVTVAPVVRVDAAPSEDDQIKALVDDVLATPGKYPEIEARARRLTGEGYSYRPDSPVSAAAPGTSLPAGDVHLDSYWRGWDDALKSAPAYPCHGCGGSTYESTLTGVPLRMCDACQRAYERPAMQVFVSELPMPVSAYFDGPLTFEAMPAIPCPRGICTHVYGVSCLHAESGG